MVARPEIELFGAPARLSKEWFKHEEIIVCGPAGTGKSMGIAFVVDDLACMYPGARFLVGRKTRAALTQSWCKTFRKAMRMRGQREHLFHGQKDKNRTDYTYDNGSEIVLGSMEDEERLFSTEYDFVYIMECTELIEDEWQSMHRALRNGVLPHQLLLGDCNPSTEYHWALKRIKRGMATLFPSVRSDNPWFKTSPGRKFYIRMRDRTRGAVHKRLFEGIWTSASGAVYPQFSAQRHVIKAELVKRRNYWALLVTKGFGAEYDAPKELEIVAFLGAQDWGWRAPGCLQVWAVTKDGRLFMVREWYVTEKLRAWWAERAAEQHKALGLERAICDCADPEAVRVFNNLLSWDERSGSDPIAIGAVKTKTDGGQTNIDLVRDRLEDRADGYPGIFFLDNALQHAPDPSLEDQSKPTCSAEEFPAYVLEDVKVDRLGREAEDKERPRKVNNHGINATEYLVRYCHGRAWDEYKAPIRIKAGSFAARHGFTPDSHPHIFGLAEPEPYEYEEADHAAR